MLGSISMVDKVYAKDTSPDAISAAVGQEVMYPLIARAKGWEGQAQVAIHPKKGVSLYHTSGSPELDRAALEAAQSAFDKGAVPQPEHGTVVVPVIFRLATH
jgi:TonB family protein